MDKNKHNSNWYTIVKYNPNKYDRLGRYTTDEWTGLSDVGKFKDGHIVTADEYLEVENRCVNAVVEIVHESNIPYLWTRGLEFRIKKSDINILKRTGIYKRNSAELWYSLKIRNNRKISISKLSIILKSLFRNNCWLYLRYSPNDFEIRISEYYYIYIKTKLPREEVVRIASKYGLYVDPRDWGKIQEYEEFLRQLTESYASMKSPRDK